MAEETLTSHEIPVAKLAEDNDSNLISAKITGENIKQMEKEVHKEEEDTSLDGEFIKVEKEAETNAVAGEEPSVDKHTVSASSPRELLETQEKARELEEELHKISGALKESESKNARLKDELLLTKEKHQETAKKYEGLELNHKKLQEQISETEDRHTSQLKTLQETLRAQEEKHKELINVKEAFDGLSLELEASRKKMEELEVELRSSTGEARKFEEMHKQSGLHAELETKKALEFEKLLEMAKSSAKDVEAQMASLQDEVKGLYERIAENERVEEALKSATAELSAVNGELELSKSRVQELSQELEVKRASELKAKDDIASLENVLASTKESLEEVREHSNNQETKAKIIEEELTKVNKEKEDLEEAVRNLADNNAQMKELCNDLKAKLQQSDENFCKADSLLSEAVANNKELEEKLKALEELHSESGHAVTSTNQKNLELEDTVQALNAAAEEAKSQLRESETRCIAAEQRTLELEQLLNLEELKGHDYQRESRELSEKIAELKGVLKKEVEEKQQLDTQLQEFQITLAQMESDLGNSQAHISELEIELKNVTDKCVEHEGRANTVHQRSFELEDLIKSSDSKAVDAGKKVGELELLLETEKYRIKELEELISLLEKRNENSEAESLKSSRQVSELEAQFEVVQSKASDLEAALKASTKKEKELTECLNAATEENKNLKDASKSSNEKLSEAENLVDILRNELNVSQQKLDMIENDLKAAGAKENEFLEKIKLAEEQLEEAIQKLGLKDLEAEELYGKLRAFEAQVKTHEEQAQEATVLVKSRESEIEKLSIQFEKETQALVEANLKLNQDLASHESKLSDLEMKLSIVSTEKDETVEELNNARKEVEVLTRRLASEGQKLQSQISSVMEENNLLNETYQSSKKDLETMILRLEEQLKEQKSNEDGLKAKVETFNFEVAQKAELQNHLKELQEQLATAEARFKGEKESSSQKELEREAALKHSFEELEAKEKEVLLLENQVKELNQRLQQANDKSKEKDVEGITTEAKDETIKSREIEPVSSSPSKRKHKKTSAQALSSDTTQVHSTTEASSPIMTLKFIFGVALVSVIFGIILGKKY